jgi:hypothetical protein
VRDESVDRGRDCKAEGKRAHARGKGIDQNPYRYGKPWWLWQLGWMSASDEIFKGALDKARKS